MIRILHISRAHNRLAERKIDHMAGFGDAGLIFPEGDADALARLLAELREAPSRCASLAERGYARAMRLFTPELGLPHDRPIVLFVGRLRYYKGLTDLLRALPAVADAHLALVGDGPLRGECLRLIDELGMAGRVTMAGHVEDVDLARWYLAADLFVLPSNTRAEAFGTAIVEAMAAGLPVVSTEIETGTSWVNLDGRTGLTVPPRDPPALAAAINRLVADAPLREAYGRNGRQRAEETFGVNAMLAAIEQVYEDVLNEPPRAAGGD
jgi:glycosyltransferase involved in cell wall biosynthesis